MQHAAALQRTDHVMAGCSDTPYTGINWYVVQVMTAGSVRLVHTSSVDGACTAINMIYQFESLVDRGCLFMSALRPIECTCCTLLNGKRDSNMVCTIYWGRGCGDPLPSCCHVDPVLRRGFCALSTPLGLIFLRDPFCNCCTEVRYSECFPVYIYLP